MRTVLIVAATIGVSAPAFAQTAAPKVGAERLKVARPPAPGECAPRQFLRLPEISPAPTALPLTPDLRSCRRFASPSRPDQGTLVPLVSWAGNGGFNGRNPMPTLQQAHESRGNL
jgi:hypothetical protein